MITNRKTYKALIKSTFLPLPKLTIPKAKNSSDTNGKVNESEFDN